MSSSSARQAILLADTTLTIPKRFNALLSFHTVSEPEEVIALSKLGYRFVADSGAYSVASIGAVIDIDEYAEWCHVVKNHVCWMASLDVIGDADGSFENFKYLRNKGLDIIPTIHYPASPTLISKYIAFDSSIDFFGLGGSVGVRDAKNLLRWFVEVFRYVRDHHPQVRFHGWGCSGTRLVSQVPFYSVDSSAFKSGQRWGSFVLHDDRSLKRWQYQANGKDAYLLKDELKRLYDLNPSQISTSTPENWGLVIYFAARSSVNLQKFLRKRFGEISAPSFGSDGQNGINVHNVLTPQDLRLIAPLLKEMT